MMRAVLHKSHLLALTVLVVAFAAADGIAMDKAHLRWVRSKPKIDSIVVQGNTHFSDGTIKKRMYSRVSSLWTALKGDRRARIQRETMERDTLEIKYLYMTNGYLGIRVDESFEMLLPDSSAAVNIVVDEGWQFRYGEKKITGSYPKRFNFGFNKVLHRLKENEPINFFDVEAAAFELKTILANDGYPYANVAYNIDSVDHSVLIPITFDIRSDSLVHFGEMNIEGDDKYPEYVARRELKIVPNDVYRRRTILNSQQRLFESGYFSTLQLVQSKESADRLRPDFTLKVRERKPRYVTVTTGAGQSEFKDLIWDFTTGFGKRNFFGSRRYDLLADYSFSLGHDVRLVQHRYRLRYTEPWFMGVRMPLVLTGQWEPRLKDPVGDYKIESWSVSISTLKKFGPRVRTNVGLEYESIEISGVSDELKEVIKQENGISVRRNVYFSYRRDTRDNLFIPQWGSVTDFQSEHYGGVLGGDDNFNKLEGSWSKYQVTWPGWVAATRLKAGWVEAFGKSDVVPVNDRLYLGGANTIRGFRENSLGPQGPEGDPIGANFTFIFNQEFRWRTIQIFQWVPVLKDLFRSLPLYQSLFFDMGNGYLNISDARLSSMAYSYGTGFQIVSPAGPIRIDYARVLDTDDFDFDYRWHFTILYAF